MSQPWRAILNKEGGDMRMPVTITQEREIAAKVRELQQAMSPDVQNINFDIKPDWSGDWGIFFRVLLSDEASGGRLWGVTRGVESRLSELIDFPSLGLFDST